MSLRLSEQEHEAIKALADREHRSVSAQIRLLIAQATQREERE